MTKCQAKTKKGTACKNPAKSGTNFCGVHRSFARVLLSNARDGGKTSDGKTRGKTAGAPRGGSTKNCSRCGAEGPQSYNCDPCGGSLHCEECYFSHRREFFRDQGLNSDGEDPRNCSSCGAEGPQSYNCDLCGGSLHCEECYFSHRREDYDYY